MDDEQIATGHGQKWWYEMLTLDSQRILMQIKTPQLLMQTLDDINVDAPGGIQM